MNEERLNELFSMINEGYPSIQEQEIRDYITNLQEELYSTNQVVNELLDVKEENERLKREVSKLHIIQEEYGNHIENTHIIDDYQKTYFMSNKYLIELKNGKFVDINALNDEYEDYKSKCEKAIEIIKIEKENMGYAKNDSCLLLIEKALTGGDKE